MGMDRCDPTAAEHTPASHKVCSITCQTPVTFTDALIQGLSLEDAKHAMQANEGRSIGNALCSLSSFEKLLRDEPINDEVINAALHLGQLDQVATSKPDTGSLDVWVLSTFMASEVRRVFTTKKTPYPLIKSLEKVSFLLFTRQSEH